MNVDSYLKTYQNIAYKSLKSSFKNDRISHAYLLSGERGIPLKDIAVFIAQSLLCDNSNPLACQNCSTCNRIKNNTYTDLTVLDGSNISIKKGEVKELIADFSLSANESKGISIYIINIVEGMRVEAINSILKFLEEPTENTYAILTTENQSKVLPTIISRCEVIRLLPVDNKIIIDSSLKKGAALVDAELLAPVLGSSDLVIDNIEEENYIAAKESFEKAIKTLPLSRNEAIFIFESEIIPLMKNCKGKLSLSYFLAFLINFYKDVSNKQINCPTVLSSYDNIIKEVSNKETNVDSKLEFLLSMEGEIETNISKDLLLDHIVYTLTKE